MTTYANSAPPTGATESSYAEVQAAVAAAAAAAPVLAATPPADRAGWLEALAHTVERHTDELAATADLETGLGRARLDGEVARCATQLRFYARVCADGAWLGATIDHAAGAAPDLRRMNIPLGPVAVFGASNFPFGFGTLGNDTGSALAAGCPVVVKGHPAHPRTHARLAELAGEALGDAGAPAGSFGAVTGMAAGQQLVLAEALGAVAFTGSEAGGMALHRLATTRPVPIPVYAEMGTVNAVVLTQAAAAEAAAVREIAAGALGSFTLGLGQFCTKPGLILAPSGSGLGTALADALRANPPAGVMLTTGIHEAFGTGIQGLLAAGATPVASSDAAAPLGPVVWVLTADPKLLQPGSTLLRECFGPVVLVVEYADAAQRDSLIAALPGALVASVMTGGSDDPETPGLVAALTPKVGRVAVDAWPTGVATTWAQQHGGPWPATTDPRATSVGAGALDRFTRPVAYQDAPKAALPPALRKGNPWRIVRRVDGRVRVPREHHEARVQVP